MKTFLLFVLVFSNNILAFSQHRTISGKISDSVNGEVLPFANIMVKGYPLGTTSDINGLFELSCADSIRADTLIISFIGYKSLKYPVKTLTHNNIKLSESTIDINEVVVKPNQKKVKTIILNEFNKRDCSLRYSISPFDTTGNLNVPYRPTEPTIEAIYFPYDAKFSESTRLKSVKLRVKSYADSATFRLRVFRPDNNNPGADILVKSLIIKVSKNESDVTVDLTGENIIFPETGIFIGFELLIIPENLTTITNNLGGKSFLYSPFIYQLRDNNISSTWIYSKGEWSKSKYWYFNQGVWIESDKINLANRKIAGPYMFKPAISLTLNE